MKKRQPCRDAKAFSLRITCAVEIARRVYDAIKEPIFFNLYYDNDKDALQRAHEFATDVLFGKCLCMEEYNGWKLYFNRRFGKKFQQWPQKYQDFVMNKFDEAFESEPAF